MRYTNRNRNKLPAIFNAASVRSIVCSLGTNKGWNEQCKTQFPSLPRRIPDENFARHESWTYARTYERSLV